MSIIFWLDYIGTMVFAMSGVLTAAEKRFDLFGVINWSMPILSMPEKKE